MESPTCLPSSQAPPGAPLRSAPLTLLRQFLRALFFLTVAWLSILWGALYLPFWNACHRDRRAHLQHIARGWGRLMLWAAGMQVEVRGLENVPPGPLVLVANHQGNLDIPLLMGHFPRQFRFVIKHELTRVPFFARCARLWGYISIDRQDKEAAYQALQAAARHFEAQECILLFPEGSRSRDGQLHRFKRGAFSLARLGGVPILPLAITGTFEAWPPGRFLFLKSGKLTLTIGAPISMPDVEPAQLLDRWSMAARETIQALLAQA